MTHDHQHAPHHPRMGALAIVFNILICLALLAAGFGVAAYFMQNRVSAKKVRKPPAAPLVEVMTPEHGNATLQLRAMGSVTPSREVVLKPEVSGTVIAISPHLTPGGVLQAGDQALRLDPRQYELEVAKREIGVQSAEADLALEQGQQVVAREELRMLSAEEQNPILETDLALRKPQLLQAKAALESAKADLEQAKLDLARTEIRAPFNALVTELDVNLGSQVTAGTALATIVGTDEFWVEAALPLDVLNRLDLDQPGGVPVTVEPQSGGCHWEGRLVRLSGELDDESMMATGIVVVQAPLAPRNGQKRPLILGEYVTLEFDSQPLENVFALPRGALREGSLIWVLAGEPGQRRLDVRQVTPVGKDRDTIYVNDGLRQGEQVIVSELSGAVAGMQVSIAGDPAPETFSKDQQSQGAGKGQQAQGAGTRQGSGQADDQGATTAPAAGAGQ